MSKDYSVVFYKQLNVTMKNVYILKDKQNLFFFLIAVLNPMPLRPTFNIISIFIS